MSKKFTTFSMFWIQEHHTYAEKRIPISRSFHEPLLNAETSSEHLKSWSLFFIQKSQYSNTDYRHLKICLWTLLHDFALQMSNVSLIIWILTLVHNKLENFIPCRIMSSRYYYFSFSKSKDSTYTIFFMQDDI